MKSYGVCHKVFFPVTGIILLVALSACKIFTSTGTPEPPGTQLRFQLIEKADLHGNSDISYQGHVPVAVVVSNVEDIVRIQDWITPETLADIQSVNYNSSMVIALFRGRQGSDGYAVDIREIRQLDREITVYIHFESPQPGIAVRAIVTSPYTIVEMPRDGLQGEIKFLFNVDGEVIQQIVVDIP